MDAGSGIGFELAAGTVIGLDHVRRGATFIGGNNQDAHSVIISSRLGLAIGVVCDGCGSHARSELGAAFTASLVADEVLRSLLHRGDRWAMIEEWVLGDLRDLAGLYRRANPSEFLFSTIVGFLILEEEDTTTIFHIGDGYFGVNHQLTQLESPIENTPPYLAYQILSPNDEANELFRAGLGDRPYSFQTATWRTQDVTSVFVATDGLRHLIGNVGEPLPTMPSQRVPSVDEILSMDDIFLNPFRLGNLLNAINAEGLRVEDGRARRVPGFLLDDTTMVIARRRPPEDGGII